SVNGGPDSKYIQSAELNGAEWNKTYIKHSDLVNDGHIKFTMAKTPNKNWGVENESSPTSMTHNSPDFVYSDLIAPESAKADEYVNVSVKVTNNGGPGTAHTKLYREDRSSHYRRGHLVGEDKRVLATGESAEINFSVPLYIYSYHNFIVDTLKTTTMVNRNR
ncbi:MAG: hypothetical protein KAS71_19265, partial [Bacteroidales bacterium]|nr:hypothetical protein [Bacteroidales bacterium]